MNDNNSDCVNSHYTNSDNDDELYVPSSKRLKQNSIPQKINTSKTTNIVTSRVTSALDRTKVSDQIAMYVLSATV